MKKNVIELNKTYQLVKLCKDMDMKKDVFGQLKESLYDAEFKLFEGNDRQLMIEINGKNIGTNVKAHELSNHPDAKKTVKAIISTLTRDEINEISFDHEKFDKALKFFTDTVGNILDDIKTLEDVIELYSSDVKNDIFYMLSPLLDDYERKPLYAMILNIHHLTDTSKNADISMQKIINYLDCFEQRVNKEPLAKSPKSMNF